MRVGARHRADGDAFGLAAHLHESVHRHLSDLSSPELYSVALAGTKHVVSDFLGEIERGLRWLAKHPEPGLDARTRRRRFERAARVYGRSALVLSGGATLGFIHLGVVKGLWSEGLLPDILSGASTGAMVAAGVCTRTDAELAELFANPDLLRLDGLKRVGLLAGLRRGAWLDADQIETVLRDNVGGMTFAEAYATTGRALSISVSPTRHRQKPRLLSHLTAPQVVVVSAVLASSALPGLFPPVQLVERGPGGERPYIEGERWVDGSIHGDVPKQRLSRLHNVNHFIVSQTNPHVLPFIRHRQRTVTAVAYGQLRSWVDLGRRVAPRGRLARLANSAHAMLSQDYQGDIEVHPDLPMRAFRKIMSNPTPADLAHYIRAGERSVWPQIARIRNQTRIGRAFDACVAALAS